jgi:hypothetical protein
MREVVDRQRIETFLNALARSVSVETIERGHARDLADVHAMLSRGLITVAAVKEQFAIIAHLLYRFPAIDPDSFSHAVEKAMDRGT